MSSVDVFNIICMRGSCTSHPTLLCFCLEIQTATKSPTWLVVRHQANKPEEYETKIGSLSTINKNPCRLVTCFHAGILLNLFDPEDGDGVPPKRRLTFNGLLNSVAFSPQANYTERATAACRRT
jgi:hypothetical protein